MNWVMDGWWVCVVRSGVMDGWWACVVRSGGMEHRL